MSENKENVTVEKDVNVTEEAIVIKEENKKNRGQNIFFKRLGALLIDQIFNGAVAYILLLVFDMILRIAAGYYVADKLGMYLIFFIACSIICPLISESTKFGNTIGRKFTGLKTVVE